MTKAITLSGFPSFHLAADGNALAWAQSDDEGTGTVAFARTVRSDAVALGTIGPQGALVALAGNVVVWLERRGPNRIAFVVTRERSLWGPPARVKVPLRNDAIATVPGRAEVVFAGSDQLYRLGADRRPHGLISLPARTTKAMEFTSATGVPLRTHTPRAVLGRVGCGDLAVVADQVVWTAAADASAPAQLLTVPLAGGLPRVAMALPDSESFEALTGIARSGEVAFVTRGRRGRTLRVVSLDPERPRTRFRIPLSFRPVVALSEAQGDLVWREADPALYGSANTGRILRLKATASKPAVMITGLPGRAPRNALGCTADAVVWADHTGVRYVPQ